MGRAHDKFRIICGVAESFAQLSTCSARAKVGAVLYDDNLRIVATGYNGAPQGLPHCDSAGCILDKSGSCIAAVHAEMNAILQCAFYGISTQGLHLYSTHSPCDRCAVVIVRAGIKSVSYGVAYHKDNRAKDVFAAARITYGQWPGKAGK